MADKQIDNMSERDKGLTQTPVDNFLDSVRRTRTGPLGRLATIAGGIGMTLGVLRNPVQASTGNNLDGKNSGAVAMVPGGKMETQRAGYLENEIKTGELKPDFVLSGTSGHVDLGGSPEAAVEQAPKIDSSVKYAFVPGDFTNIDFSNSKNIPDSINNNPDYLSFWEDIKAAQKIAQGIVGSAETLKYDVKVAPVKGGVIAFGGVMAVDKDGKQISEFIVRTDGGPAEVDIPEGEVGKMKVVVGAAVDKDGNISIDPYVIKQVGNQGASETFAFDAGQLKGVQPTPTPLPGMVPGYDTMLTATAVAPTPTLGGNKAGTGTGSPDQQIPKYEVTPDGSLKFVSFVKPLSSELVVLPEDLGNVKVSLDISQIKDATVFSYLNRAGNVTVSIDPSQPVLPDYYPVTLVDSSIGSFGYNVIFHDNGADISMGFDSKASDFFSKNPDKLRNFISVVVIASAEEKVEDNLKEGDYLNKSGKINDDNTKDAKKSLNGKSILNMSLYSPMVGFSLS